MDARGPRMAEVLHLTVSIARTPADVYAFAADPRNLPLWAEGLARSDVRQQGDAWVVEGPAGRVTVRFAPPNDFGVMDHDVELPSGVIVHNPMRVLPNGEGSELVFSLFRQPGMSDEQFVADRSAVEKDLDQLKSLLEENPALPSRDGASG
ncbi:Polyketide cyclase/dehydrase [Thioalkalivibrio sp. K90mix]|uniref:SRPBCC family protein n=1 Tax=Thioalkalivibrio sp. (strain K90mix) TaxID=396595 RepID=UPI000195AA17|nr:SRPBCC family protein [Thioalkalivibrio sp. K90mix]ADC71920.1 Polyketide cyclase/dehydrase [Thioalkalivibrio sp. K90mix]